MLGLQVAGRERSRLSCAMITNICDGRSFPMVTSAFYLR